MATSTGHPTAKPSAPKSGAAASVVWLNGDVLGCRCPECGAPVSIRAWLMMGDCLRCGTSFELTEEQIRQAQRLLERKTQPPATPPKPVPQSKPTPKPVVQTVPPRPVPPAPKLKPAPPPPPLRQGRRAAAPTVAVQKPFSLADFCSDLPSWLVSMIVHMLLIILLALWIPPTLTSDTGIVLSAVLGPHREEGEQGELDSAIDEVQVAFPGASSSKEIETPALEPQPLVYARLVDEPIGLQPKFDDFAHSPELSKVFDALERRSRDRMFESRDPRVRALMINREGGTTLTEAAVARGLRWIAKHQHDDGSWSLNRFHRAQDCNGRCGGAGHESDIAATALALLPMLGAGQTHKQGRYAEQADSGLKYLMARQRPDGDLRDRGVGRMYAHGQATIVLCEAYALTSDTKLRDAAQRAVDFIVTAQHPAGGWRYHPGEAGDTSVVGWQLMALHSARMAKLDVAQQVFDRADAFLNQVQGDTSGGVYGYQPHRPPTATMTAEALLCRQYLGWPADHPGLRFGSSFLVRNYLPRKEEPNIYYWYYATQVMHHMGGRRWETWNAAMRDTLVEMQETEGHQAGSWSPVGGAIGTHDTDVGGRLYMTALATCTLEVYYRHLPIYREIDVDRSAAQLSQKQAGSARSQQGSATSCLI